MSGWMINRDEGALRLKVWAVVKVGSLWIEYIVVDGVKIDCTIDYWILVGEGLYAGRCSF